MCEPTSIAMVGLTAASTAASMAASAAQQKALAKANRKNAIEMMKQANISNANARLQQVDLATNAAMQTSDINLREVQTLGLLDVNLGESGFEGNSANRIRRSIGMNFSRDRQDVLNAYERDYSSLYYQQLGTSMTAGANISNLAARQPSRNAVILNGIADVANGATKVYGAYRAYGGNSNNNSNNNRSNK